MSQMGRSKGRSQRTYENKCKKLEVLYNRCPKIQAKYSLAEWLSKIKQPSK